ncbi:MAG TPA: Ig-like domain-containing protein, partial [Luteolibacter sp.]
SDGRTWFKGNLPSTLRDIAVGQGKLVAITSTGGVLVAGSTNAGGAAPLVKVEQPSHNSYLPAGTTAEITGTSIDPEGQAVTTECWVDGVSIGSSSGSRFRFTFKPTSTTGHVISLRGRDPQGLVGSDELKISAIAPQLRNDFESLEGKDYLPTKAWVSFGGRAYASGGFSLYRTRHDGTWEPVLLPSLTSAITNLVSGNGTLIVQTVSSTFITRDGVNWSQITTLSGGNMVFQNGWFVGFFYDSYYGRSQTFLSRDGLAWTFGYAPSSDGNWSPSTPTVTPGGALLTTPPYRSTDGGINWIAMPEFGTANSTQLQYATAFDAVFAGLPNGRILRSTDDGRSWAQVAQFPALPTGQYVRIAYQSGRLYWGGGGSWLAGSSNGTDWQSLTGDSLQSSTIAQVNGRFVGFGRVGMVWSSDGFDWQLASVGPTNPARGLLVENGDALLLGDTNGGAWGTEDGMAWLRVIQGKLLQPAPAYNSNAATATRIKIGSTTVVGGGAANSGFLWNSTSDGLEWTQSTYHGGALSGVTISNLWSDGTTAFAATSMILPENRILKGLWRSLDGRDWHQLWSWSGAEVVSMISNNDEWLALGADGQLRRSTDGGDTWSADFRPAQLQAGRLLVRFDNVWIVFGTEVANFQGSNFVYVSTDNGQTWTRSNAPGAETSWSTLACATKAGAIVVTSSSGKIYTATDRNLVWTNTATLAAIYGGFYRIDLVGGKFCVQDKIVSDDGFTWTIPTKIGSST